jgi:Type IV secretion system pilin
MSIKLFSSLTIFIGIFSTLLFSSTVLANNTTDITKSGFKINLSDLDPVNSNPGSIYQWQDAAIMLLNSIATLLLFLVPIIAGVSLIIAAYYYILSSGDSEKASQAKTIIKWNLIAIAVAIFSYSIIYLVATILDGSIT